MTEPTPTVQLTLRLPPELHQAIRVAAMRQGKSANTLVTEILREAIK